MSTLYIANTVQTGSRGTWYGSAAEYKYTLESFIPGSNVNLDRVSIYVDDYATYTPPNNFTVSIYADGAGSTTPGALISTLSGASTPTGNSYNDYIASGINLQAGSKYWLEFALSSPTGDGDNTRVRLGVGSSGFSTLGSGWSVPDHIAIDNSATTTSATPLVYSLYAYRTPSPVYSATLSPICFLKGTLIKAGDGSEIPIETLQEGDLVATSHGTLPIKWIGKRRIWIKRITEQGYMDSCPIRIEAGALEPSVPHTDLYVSPLHGICVDNRIVNARYLVNNISICRTSSQEFPEEIHYFHLEFENEVLVLANGTLACSYFNQLSRRWFDNYPEYISRHIELHRVSGTVLYGKPRNSPSAEGQKRRWKMARDRARVLS